MAIAEHDRINVKFAQLGGTWLMHQGEHGNLEGAGNLDDRKLREVEIGLGLDREFDPTRVAILERRLTGIVYGLFKRTPPQSLDEGKHFASWCPEFHKNVTGLILPVASFDSSHYRASLVAASTAFLLEEAIKDPNVPIIGGQGTDTADNGALPVVDAFVFDTSLPPFTFSGADRSHLEKDSDAPDNFKWLSRLARMDLRWFLQYPYDPMGSRMNYPRSGVYWPYHNDLYHIVDLVKISPQEGRVIDEQTTFFSPNVHSIDLDVWDKDQLQKDITPGWQQTDCRPVEPDHIATRVTAESIYDALSSVYTVDLGSSNRIGDEIAQILNPSNKVVVVAAHGLGNTNNPIRWACVEAAKRDKIVIDTSRCLVGNVNQRYAGSLLDANITEGELLDSDKVIVSGRRFNKTVARAVGTRAILEGMDQQGTQILVDKYHQARFIEQDGYIPFK